MTSAYAIEVGEVTQVLAGFNDNAFDALLCDPPYGFSFMGKSWDYDVPSPDLWRECLRVLKPGAPLLAFGGSRTYHRLACGIEDAGFELRDCLMWLYGKGFPKSQNIGLAIDKAAGAVREVDILRPTNTHCTNLDANGRCLGHRNAGRSTSGETFHAAPSAPATALAKAWDGYGTALKPAFEPIVLARKPLEGTMAQNVARWGVGGLAIDACRIGVDGGTTKGNPPKGVSNGVYGDGLNGNCEVVDIGAGRWPANLLLSEEAAPLLDAEAGERPSNPFRENVAEGSVLPLKRRTAGGYADGGGPSRFFYTSKVSTREREAGCELLPKRSAGECTDREEDSAGLDNPRAGAGRTGGARNHHPTLKPIALIEYLARLILPPTHGATLLVPFAGAGSEMAGALRAGWGAVFGIEREAEYVEIARARLRHWCPESEAA